MFESRDLVHKFMGCVVQQKSSPLWVCFCARHISSDVLVGEGHSDTMDSRTSPPLWIIAEGSMSQTSRNSGVVSITLWLNFVARRRYSRVDE